MHGLYRALIANMIEGVSKGYKTSMELIGVGYKANAQSNVLELSLGYSHNVFLAIPSEVKITATQEKGGNPTITLEGYDKQLVGQVAAKIKSLGMNVVRLTYAIEMVDDYYSDSPNQSLQNTLTNALGSQNGSAVLQEILKNNPNLSPSTTRLEVRVQPNVVLQRLITIGLRRCCCCSG